MFNLVSCTKPFCLNSNRNTRKQFVISPAFAKKKEYSQNSTTPKKTIFPLKFFSSKNLIIQSGIGVFALGFIDAGYSGDWSRIGVISRGTEDLLKAAAFLVVPLCIFLIFFLFENDGYEE
ncbi:uncharacterized protein LOC131005040 [Salvia miltiorrhiza]|uniref:uncharacterized protein LOC131005040 n=1 Tax=Salvia miltiorrhiza TaxID=226208 RepID=UPI0025AC6F0D|nr:uncharacterized protein LOC131005040 [Salvia miltiorrhiza]